ncbi:MAG: TetR/AcrR family transcriptional regulator [Burkholderiales bacterium]|nr:TetR/AcrR family transcriptional regulator [Burkholderiales bacterium]
MAKTASRRVNANVKDEVLVAERREAIVKAAVEVFLEKGFHAATTRDVCVRAGITQGTLYNYVRSKEDILYLVCDQAASRYQEAITAALDAIADPRERLVRMVRATVQAQYRFRNHILLVNREAHLLDAPARAAIRARADSFFNLVRSIVEAALPQGHPRGASAALCAEMVSFLPVLFAFRPWRLKGAVEKNIDGMVDLLLCALGVSDAGPDAPRSGSRPG